MQYIKTGKALTSGWTDLLKETHASGTLKSIAIAGGPIYHHFKITLDDRLLVSEMLSGNHHDDSLQNNSITINLNFSKNIHVQIRGEPGISGLATYWVVYEINEDEHKGVPQVTIDFINGRVFSKTRYENYERNEWDVYQLGSTLRSSIYLDRDVILPNRDISGILHLTNYGDIKTKLEQIHLICRIPGSNTIIDQSEPISIFDAKSATFKMRNPLYSSSSIFSDYRLSDSNNFDRSKHNPERRPYDHMDRFSRLKLELVADIKEAENIPSQVTLL